LGFRLGLKEVELFCPKGQNIPSGKFFLRLHPAKKKNLADAWPDSLFFILSYFLFNKPNQAPL